MKNHNHTIQETHSLRKAMRDFLVGWLELVGLFHIMALNGVTKEQRSEILEAALKAVIEEVPGDDKKEAAARVRELFESYVG